MSGGSYLVPDDIVGQDQSLQFNQFVNGLLANGVGDATAQAPAPDASTATDPTAQPSAAGQGDRWFDPLQGLPHPNDYVPGDPLASLPTPDQYVPGDPAATAQNRRSTDQQALQSHVTNLLNNGGGLATVGDGVTSLAPTPSDSLTNPLGTGNSGVVPLTQPAFPSGGDTLTPAATPYDNSTGAAPSDQQALDRIVPDSSSREAFIASAMPLAKAWEAKTGIPAAYFLAVNGSESNWGKAPGNELFGIKARPGNASTGPLATWEAGQGGVNAEFSAYPTANASYADFVNLISTSPRYAPAWQQFQQDHDPAALFQNLNKAGYATDPQWGSKVASIASGIGTTSTRPVEDRTAPGDVGSSVNRPSQFSLGLSYSDALAACGPTAALALANKYGDGNIPIDQVMQAARDNNLWDPKNGMHGVQAEQQLLADEGVKTRLESNDQALIQQGKATPLDWSHIRSDASNGNPVVLSTPGHYFVIDGYDPQTGAYHVGTSGTDLKLGAEWMTTDRMQSLEGQVSGALYVDNPNAHGPSVAEQSASNSPLDAVGNAKDQAVSDFSSWANSLGNPLQSIDNAKDQAVSALTNVKDNAVSAVQNAPGALLSDIGINTDQTPPPPGPPQRQPIQGGDLTGPGSPIQPVPPSTQDMGSVLRAQAASDPVLAKIASGGQAQPQDVRNIVGGYEAAHDQAVANLNPASDVPVLGGLSNGVIGMATDPLTYAASPEINAGTAAVKTGVAKIIGPELAAKVPEAIKWAADQGLTGATWGAAQQAVQPSATPGSVAKGAATGAAFGIGAGAVTGVASGDIRLPGRGTTDTTAPANATTSRPLSPAEQVEAQATYRQVAKAVHPDTHPGIDPQLMVKANQAYANGDLDTLRSMANDLGVTVTPPQVASADANQSWFGAVKNAASNAAESVGSGLSSLADIGRQAAAWVFRNPQAPVADRGSVLVLASDLSQAADRGDAAGASTALQRLSGLGQQIAADPADAYASPSQNSGVEAGSVPVERGAPARLPAGPDSGSVPMESTTPPAPRGGSPPPDYWPAVAPSTRTGTEAAQATDFSDGAPIPHTSGLHVFGQTSEHSPNLLAEVASRPSIPAVSQALSRAFNALQDQARQQGIVQGQGQFAGLAYGPNYRSLSHRDAPDSPSTVAFNLYQSTDQVVRQLASVGLADVPQVVAAALADRATEALAHELAHTDQTTAEWQDASTAHDQAFQDRWAQLSDLAEQSGIKTRLTGDLLGIVRPDALREWGEDHARLRSAVQDTSGPATAGNAVANTADSGGPAQSGSGGLDRRNSGYGGGPQERVNVADGSAASSAEEHAPQRPADAVRGATEPLAGHAEPSAARVEPGSLTPRPITTADYPAAFAPNTELGRAFKLGWQQAEKGGSSVDALLPRLPAKSHDALVQGHAAAVQAFSSLSAIASPSQPLTRTPEYATNAASRLRQLADEWDQARNPRDQQAARGSATTAIDAIKQDMPELLKARPAVAYGDRSPDALRTAAKLIESAAGIYARPAEPTKAAPASETAPTEEVATPRTSKAESPSSVETEANVQRVEHLSNSRAQPSGTTLPPEQSRGERRGLPAADSGRAASAGETGAASPSSTRSGSGQPVRRGEGTSNPAAGAEPHDERPAPTRSLGPGDARGSARQADAGLAAGQDYRLTPADERWQETTPASKRFEANVDAVRRVKEIQAGRPVTEEDRAAFARYSGMGDSAYNDAFPLSRAQKPNERLVALGQQLRDLLGPEEYASLGRSRLNAHFTTPTVVKAMWDAIQRLGADNLPSLRVLEPSAGSGRFISLMPEDLHDRAAVTMAEMDLVTGEMLKALFPQASVHVMPFQRIDVQVPGAVPDNSQDIVVSNVPFGKIKVADPKYDGKPGLTDAVHNYFFVKGLDKTRPGGLVAFITSHQTFDAASAGRQDFRRYLADRAELLGAVRLPQHAFPDTAVTSDILFFRKRDVPEGAPLEPQNPEWIQTEKRTFTDEQGKPVEVSINRYFLDHPEMALGEHSVSRHTTDGQKSGYVLKADKSTPIEDQLREALTKLPKDALTPRDETTQLASPETLAAQKTVEGSFVEHNGALHTLADGKLRPAGRYIERGTGANKTRTWTPYTEPEVARIRAMLKVHDLGRSVLDLQRAGAPANKVSLAQAELKRAYDSFVKSNGPLHTAANRALMRSDPRSYWVQALEKWGDRLEQAWSKEARLEPGSRSKTRPVTEQDLAQLRTDIFSKTLQSPPRPVTSAETPKDALMVSLNERGTLDFARMRELLGRPEAEIARDLHRDRLIYRNPAQSGKWELADEYLSGNVRQKLVEAERAARKDAEAYQANVDALQKVQPPDLKPGDIDVRLGTAWLPESDVNQFFRDTLGKPSERTRFSPFRLMQTSDSSMWRRTSRYDDYSLDPAKAREFGTDRMGVLDIAEHVMNAQTIRILDNVGTSSSPKYELNEDATRAAQGKARALAAAFKNWIWTDAERAARLAQFYNETFNTWRNREFDGAHLEFASSNPNIQLRPHQKDAVWRGITTPSMLLAHEVGYGKSMTMAALAMELRRLGLARRPVIVVPNHLVGQMATEFYKLYPQANLLVPDAREFEPAGRATLMSRIATGDWDGIILPQSQFKLLPVHPATALRFGQQLEAELQQVIQSYVQGAGGRVDKQDRTFKDLQKRLENVRADLQKVTDRLQAYQAEHTHSLMWDELGVDALMVDEADQFKNLQFFTTRSRIKGLPNSKSDRAFDMHMKTRILLEQNGRGVVFATGTPISNTIAELWTMLRYLAPQTLQELGLGSFDGWASAFGETVSKLEQTLTGEWKPVDRFAKFTNAPELSALFQRVADIRMAEDSPDMELRKPPMKGGGRIKVKSEALDWHRAYAKSLAERAKNLKGMPAKGADNMLKITGDARKASLDPSLVGGPEHPNGKIAQLVDRVHAVWQREAAERGTQLVFLDLGTPKSSEGLDKSKLPPELKTLLAQRKAESGDGWDDADEEATIRQWYADQGLGDPQEQQQIADVYNRIKDKLVARGIPAEQIAFIHDAKNDRQRKSLFKAVNDGQVRVLIGSTEKMGAGTNVQERLAALHHLDTPWRPRDLEQREGRGLRPGNVAYGPVVETIRDPKDGVYKPVLKVAGRGVEVYQYVTEWPFDAYLWSTLLSKARAIKSMMRRRVADRSVLDADEHVLDMEELEALASGDPIAVKRRGVQEELRQLEAEERDHRNRQASAAADVQRLPAQIAINQRQLAQARTDVALRDLGGEGFGLTIHRTTFDKRPEAGEALVDAIKRLPKASDITARDWKKLGAYRGFDLLGQASEHGFDLALGNPGQGKRPGEPEYQSYRLYPVRWADLNPAGIVQRVENLAKGINAEVRNLEFGVREKQERLEGLQKFLKQPYADQARLDQVRHALSLIEQRMAEPKANADGSPYEPKVTDAMIDRTLEGAPPPRPVDVVAADDNPAEDAQVAQVEQAESSNLPHLSGEGEAGPALAAEEAPVSGTPPDGSDLEPGTPTNGSDLESGGSEAQSSALPEPQAAREASIPTWSPKSTRGQGGQVAQAAANLLNAVDEHFPDGTLPASARDRAPVGTELAAFTDALQNWTPASAKAVASGQDMVALAKRYASKSPAPTADALHAQQQRRELQPAREDLVAQEPSAARPARRSPRTAEAGAPTPSADGAAVPMYEYSSTQANLPADLVAKIERYQRTIDPEDLVPETGSAIAGQTASDGLEHQPHITIKFGLHPGVDETDVARVLASEGPISVTFGNNGVFPPAEGTDGAAVLYISVDSPDLHRLHGMLKSVLPNDESYPQYQPHVTLAYIKPEVSAKYDGDGSPLVGRAATLHSITFSDRSGRQVEVPLGGRSSAVSPNGRNGKYTPDAAKGNGAGANKPPAPPTTNGATPPPEEADHQHIVGFGYQSGMSPAVEDIVRTAADSFSTGPISQAEVDRAALMLFGSDKASAQRLRDAVLSSGPATLSIQSQALRLRARAAVEAVQLLEQLHASASLKQAQGVELSQSEKEALDEATQRAVLAAAEMDLKASRRYTADVARALNQHKFTVTAQNARDAYTRLDAAAVAIDEANQVARAMQRDGHAPTPGERTKLQVAAEQLETMADSADRADAVDERIAATATARLGQDLQDHGLSKDTAAGIADRPLIEQKALELVKLTPEWRAARAAGEWDRVNQIEARRAALIHEIDDTLAQEEAERQAKPPRERKDQAKPDVDLMAAHGVISKMRREIRERMTNPDAERETELKRLNDQVRQLVLEQEVSAKDLVPKSARLVEMNKQQADARVRGDFAKVARIEQERATVLGELRDEIERQVRERIARGPRKFTSGDELERAVRDAMGKGIVHNITRLIDEQLHPEREVGRMAAQIGRRTRAEFEREHLRELAQKLRELGSSPFRQGATARTIQGIHETIQQLEAASAAGKARATEIRRSLVKAGLFRYLERRDVPERRLNDLITMVMTADTDKPEQMAQILRALREPTVWDKLREYTVINMLSSPLTWGLSGVSVLSHLLIGSGRILVATPLDALHDQLRYGGKNISIGEVPQAIRGAKATLPESLRLYGQIMRHGFTPDSVQSAVELGDLGALRREYLSESGAGLGWTHVPGLQNLRIPPWVFVWLHRLSTRPVEAAYASMGHTLYGAMLHSLAYREARKLLANGGWQAALRNSGGYSTETGYAAPAKPSVEELRDHILRNIWDFPHITKAAGEIEDYSLLRSKLDRVSAALSYLRHAPPGSSQGRQAAAFAIHQLFPFMVVPTNFIKMGLDTSVLGTTVNAFRYAGAKTPEHQAELFRKVLVGSLIAAAAIALLLEDNLTGQGPTDPAKRRMWDATHQIDSVRVGGKWVSYDGTLFAIPLGMMANAYESAQEATVKTGKTPTGDEFLNILTAALGGAAKGTGEAIASQSFVKTIGDIVRVFTGSSSPSAAIASQLDKVVPLGAMVALFARMGDGLQRDSKTFTEQLANRIPGLREEQPPALNPLGSPEPNDQQGWQGLLPFRPADRPDQNNPVIREYERLGVNLPKAPTSVRTVPLTAQEQHDYEADVGPKIEAAVTKLMSSPTYQTKLNDVQRAKVLEQIVKKLHAAEEGLALKRMGPAEIKRRLVAAKKAA